MTYERESRKEPLPTREAASFDALSSSLVNVRACLASWLDNAPPSVRGLETITALYEKTTNGLARLMDETAAREQALVRHAVVLRHALARIAQATTCVPSLDTPAVDVDYYLDPRTRDNATTV